MPLLEASRSVTLVVDMQGKLMEMIHRPQLTIEATCRLLRISDLFAVPVLLTEQYPKGLGPTHPRVLARFEALEVAHRLFEKDAFGCCSESGFAAALDELRPTSESEPRQVVVAGIEAHVCVVQTVIALIEGGDEVHVCWECVSGRGEEYRDWALQRMQQAGATITNHESVAFEWARDKNHPRFKELSALLREGQLT